MTYFEDKTKKNSGVNANYPMYVEYLAKAELISSLIWDRDWHFLTMSAHDRRPPSDIFDKKEIDDKLHDASRAMAALRDILEASVKWCELGEEGYRYWLRGETEYVECPECHGEGYVSYGECEECGTRGKILLKETKEYKNG